MANTNDMNDSLVLSDDLLYEFASKLDDKFNIHIIKQENETPLEFITIEENSDNEEQHLSQKLSQLSASEHEIQSIRIKKRSPCSSPSTKSTVSKIIKIEQEETKSKDKTLPHFLSNDNKVFNQMIQSMLSNTATSFNIEDIREIAVLIYRIANLDLQQTLWTAYVRSGKGTIENNQQTNTHINLSLWPMEVKSMMIKNGQTTTTDINQIDDDACLNYVYQTLHQIVDRKIQYDAQLDEMKSRLYKVFTFNMEDTITKFIEQQEMIFIRIEIASKIAIVEYDYKDRLFELEFQQWKPSENQLQLFHHLIKIKQEKEKSKYEVALLKQRLIHNYLPESLDTLQLPLPSSSSSSSSVSSSSIETIKDTKTRQDLLDRYTKILQQTKSEMMSLYIAIAEVRMHQCQLQFDQDMRQMRKTDERLTSKYLRLSETMIDILERRFKNIDERLEYLYNLKVRFIEKKSASHHSI